METCFTLAPPVGSDGPTLQWSGKRLLQTAAYCPARCIERYGGGEGADRLFLGDNHAVLRHLLRDYRGAVDLIYIDPPYNSGAAYTQTVRLRGDGPSGSATVRRYDDAMPADAYLQFLYERLLLARELLADTGAVYVQLDAHRAPYVRVMMDEIFGSACFQREIIWRIGWLSGYKTAVRNWVRNHDVILFYTKSSAFTFHKQYLPYDGGYVRRDGKRPRGKGHPIEDTWNCSPADRLDSIQIKSFSGEKTGYPTQKNEALLARIIEASSSPGDLVLDFFMGSGTAPVAAHRLGRRFIGADSSPGALRIAVSRLLRADPELRLEVLCTDDAKPAAGRARGRLTVENGRLAIADFRPENLPRSLTAAARDWRRTVDSVMIDFHSDGEVFAPTLLDVPEKNALVRGIYALPADASRIRVRITDLFAECTEFEIRV